MTAVARLSRITSRLAPRTLGGRLSLVALTTAALLMVLLTIAFNAVVERHLRHQADDELRTRAAAVATTIDTAGPVVRVLETSNDRLLDANVWIYAGTRLLEQPPSPATELTHLARELVERGGRRCVTTERHVPVRMCAGSVPDRRGTVTVVTALDLTPYRSSADTLLTGSCVLDVLMLTCTYALTRLAVGRALRPVGVMTDQAARWSAVASEERFASVVRPAELARLGTSLDALLDRIRAVLRHERQLTAELSHELRTPLSRIIAELDWWQSRPRSAAETRAAHTVVADAAQSMRTICDTLLDDARDGAPAAPGTAGIGPVLRRAVESLADTGHLTVTVHVDGSSGGDGNSGEEGDLKAGVRPALLERIVSPLLANSCRYARSHVTVRAYRAPCGVRIDLTDDGPGVPESFAPHLFRPGRRADPGDGHGGAGLGLPLARRLARSVGGEVTYDPGHAPGARFVVSLPAG